MSKSEDYWTSHGHCNKPVNNEVNYVSIISFMNFINDVVLVLGIIVSIFLLVCFIDGNNYNFLFLAYGIGCLISTLFVWSFVRVIILIAKGVININEKISK